jgi:hypothetical protein
MKILSTLFIIMPMFYIQSVKAQASSTIANNKGDTGITLYLGFPNFLIPSLKSAYELADQKKEQLNIRASVPVGINAFYMINDNLALGGEVSYESAKIKWRENETFFGTDSTPVTHNYLLNATRIRLLAIANYHFIIKKRSDWYFAFGLGYNYNPISLETDAMSSFNDSPCFFPLTAKTKMGCNYYLTKNLAINAEVGIGGPLLSIGTTVKL